MLPRGNPLYILRVSTVVCVSIDVGEGGLETFKSDKWRLLSMGLREMFISGDAMFCNWGGGTTGARGATEPIDGILESVCAVLMGIDAVFIVEAVRGEMSILIFSWLEEGEMEEGREEEMGGWGIFSMTGALDEITEGEAEDAIGITRGDT